MFGVTSFCQLGMQTMSFCTKVDSSGGKSFSATHFWKMGRYEFFIHEILGQYFLKVTVFNGSKGLVSLNCPETTVLINSLGTWPQGGRFLCLAVVTPASRTLGDYMFLGCQETEGCGTDTPGFLSPPFPLPLTPRGADPGNLSPGARHTWGWAPGLRLEEGSPPRKPSVETRALSIPVGPRGLSSWVSWVCFSLCVTHPCMMIVRPSREQAHRSRSGPLLVPAPSSFSPWTLQPCFPASSGFRNGH